MVFTDLISAEAPKENRNYFRSVVQLLVGAAAGRCVDACYLASELCSRAADTSFDLSHVQNPFRRHICTHIVNTCKSVGASATVTNTTNIRRPSGCVC